MSRPTVHYQSEMSVVDGGAGCLCSHATPAPAAPPSRQEMKHLPDTNRSPAILMIFKLNVSGNGGPGGATGSVAAPRPAADECRRIQLLAGTDHRHLAADPGSQHNRPPSDRCAPPSSPVSGETEPHTSPWMVKTPTAKRRHGSPDAPNTFLISVQCITAARGDRRGPGGA